MPTDDASRDDTSRDHTAHPHEPEAIAPAPSEAAQSWPAQPGLVQPDAASHAGVPPLPYPTQPQRTNTLAVVSLVVAFFLGLVGIVLGIVALVQVKRSGQRGRGLAIAGIVVGAVQAAVATVVGLILATSIALAVSTAAGLSGASADCSRLTHDLTQTYTALGDLSSTLSEDPDAALATVSEMASRLERTIDSIGDPEVAKAAQGVLDEVRDTESYLRLVVEHPEANPTDVQFRLVQHTVDIVETFDGVRSACTVGGR